MADLLKDEETRPKLQRERSMHMQKNLFQSIAPKVLAVSFAFAYVHALRLAGSYRQGPPPIGANHIHSPYQQPLLLFLGHDGGSRGLLPLLLVRRGCLRPGPLLLPPAQAPRSPRRRHPPPSPQPLQPWQGNAPITPWSDSSRPARVGGPGQEMRLMCVPSPARPVAPTSEVGGATGAPTPRPASVGSTARATPDTCVRWSGVESGRVGSECSAKPSI